MYRFSLRRFVGITKAIYPQRQFTRRISTLPPLWSSELNGVGNAFSYRILGTETQVAEIELKQGKTIRCETGSVLSLGEDMQMSTTTAGGFTKGLQRAFTGESFFLSDFTYTGKRPTGRLVLGTTSHSNKIIPLDFGKARPELICTKG